MTSKIRLGAINRREIIMRATVMFGAGDVRSENVPDAKLIEATDAVVTVTRACICGSDLWPYKAMKPSASGIVRRHEAIGVVAEVRADVRTFKAGDFVIMPSRGLMVRASSVLKGCRHRAFTADSLATKLCRERRPKLCAFHRPTERFTRCQWPKMTRCWLRCSRFQR
jgi:hypothetical protein